MTAPPPRILVVEDDRDIADLIRRYLQKDGFDVEVQVSGRDAIRTIAESHFDLLVLDVMLPEVSGLDICTVARSNEKTATIPIIMVTARAEESERIAGLDLAGLGIPSEAEYVAQYLKRTKRNSINPSHWDFYLAYNLFRIAAICQGIAKRVLDGTAASQHATEAASKTVPLADLGWRQVERILRRAA